MPRSGKRDSARLAATLRRHGSGRPDLPEEQFDALENVERDVWREEIIGHEELFLTLHDHLPKEMIYERELLICRI